MKLIQNTDKYFLAAIMNTSDWTDGSVELSHKEIDILKKALAICDKADTMTRKANHDKDDFNSFGEAAQALQSILKG